MRRSLSTQGSGVVARLERLLPFLGWPRPTWHSFRDDAVAGVTVALVAIPQSLAYAQLAGVPPEYGLYAAFIPAIVGILFGSSAILVTGPVATTALLTAASVSTLVPAGGQQFYAYVTLLALLSGVLQLGFGLARAGFLLSLVSHPVLMGFINAAALIIAMSQLSDLLGIQSARTGRLVVDVWAIIGHIGNFHPLSLAFGVTAFVLFVAFRRYAPRLPGMLITVAIMIGASRLVGFADRGGNVVGAVAAGLPGVGVPAMGWGPIAALLPAAFVIALISFMEAASSCKLIAIKKRVRWDENQELIGQGLAKISAAFCQSIPVSGSFSRSALNLASNARTGWSALVGAACVLVTLLFLTSWLWHLPKPVLAAAIMLAVVGLFDLSAFRRAWRASRDDGIAATATFIATLAFAPNIQNGLLTGIIISLAAYFYGRMRPSVEVFVVPASRAEPPAPIANAGADGTVGVLRFDAAIYFANVSYFEEAVLMLEHRNPDLRHIVVVASGINSLDASAVEMLRNLAERLRESGITLALTGVKRPVREVIERTGLIGTIGTANIFATETIAVEALRARDGSASP